MPTIHQEKLPVKKVRVISQTQKAFNVWGIIVIIWAFYRSAYGVHSALAFDEFVIKPILFVGPVLYYIFAHEHKNLAKGLWFRSDTSWKDSKVATLLSLPLLILIPFYLFFIKQQINVDNLLMIVIISLAISVTEEILSRGFIARSIFEESKSTVQTIIQASLLHMFLRIPRIMTMPDIFGWRLIVYFLSDLFLSFVVTAVFLWRKSLTSAVVVRFFYTLFLMIVLM